MNPVIKRQWIDALTSGHYEQGTGTLHLTGIGPDDALAPDRFCCLGVLCELAYRAGAVSRSLTGEEDVMIVYAYGKERHRSALPIEVVRWADVVSATSITNNSDPAVWVPNAYLPERFYPTDEGGQWWNLSIANDRRIPFSTIAELIDRNL